MKKYLINSNICESCGDCLNICPSGAIDTNDKGEYVINPTLCTCCGTCTDVCLVNAIVEIEAFEAFKTVGDFNTEFKYCSGFKPYTKNSKYFVINEELSEMFSSSGAGSVDLTGYDNKKFTTSFPAWRSKTPTGGYISFGITLDKQVGHDMIFNEVSVYCTANTHINYPHGNNYLFKYVYGVDREDKKECLVEFGCPETAEENTYRVDISSAVCDAGDFWYDNGFNSIFGKSLSPDICKKTGTDYRITSNGLFIIKDDKPLTLLCNEGYGCTL